MGIKFRGKAVETFWDSTKEAWEYGKRGDWVYGYLVGRHDGKHYIVTSTIGCHSTNLINNMLCSGVMIDPATVGQYTGLKDKNEVESYHKDIVRTNAGHIGVVEFGSHNPTGNEWDNAWGWFIQFPNGGQASMDEHFGYWGEVIDNIHKNPGLLEVD